MASAASAVVIDLYAPEESCEEMERNIGTVRFQLIKGYEKGVEEKRQKTYIPGNLNTKASAVPLDRAKEEGIALSFVSMGPANARVTSTP